MRGAGVKMVNMGELFANARLRNVPMDRVPLEQKERTDNLLKEGDLLFARQSLVRSGAGQSSIFLGDDEDVCFESHLIRCRLDPSVSDTQYYFYWFRSPEGLNAIDSIVEQGAGAAGIRGSDLAKLMVPYPDIQEQKAISEQFAALDDKIELNRRMNATLEAIAQAVFKEWFVDGAKEEWEVKTVGDLADVTSGKRPQDRFDEKTIDATVPVWGGNGPMAYTREALIDAKVLLTGRVGTLGSIFRINTPIWASDNTLLLTSRTSASYEFLLQQLKNIDFKRLNRGSTQPLLTQTDLKAQAFLMPPQELLARYHAQARVWYAKIDANENESRTLTALRDTLLPKLMRGEVRVKDFATSMTTK